MALKLTPESLADHVGQEVGVSPWLAVTQDMVDTFAEVTRDPQFIHVDPERAAQTPFGGTIAHGFLSLSMLSYFAMEGMGTSVEGAVMGLNYGFDKVRFLAPVRVGKRIRGRATLLSAESAGPGRYRFKQAVTVEIEGEDKPALVAEWITMAVTGA